MTSDRAALDRPLRTGARRRGAALWAVSTLLVATAVSCGSDSGDDDATATDPTGPTSSTTTSPSDSATDSGSGSASGSASGSPTESGDPVSSPVIDKAVKDAIEADFPALVPAGVPAGWTVVSATYSPDHGGTWRIELTDPDGASVRLVQVTSGVRALVADELGGSAASSGEVDLGEYGTGTWAVYEAPNGAALAKKLSSTAAIIVGPDQDTDVALAEQLLTAEDSGNGTGDG